DLNRFNLIKEKINYELDPKALYEKALSKMNDVYLPFYKMIDEKQYIAIVRLEGVKILYTLTEVIALANQTFIKRGRKHLKSEILKMKYVPIDFEILFDQFFLENNPAKVVDIITNLIRETKLMLESLDYYTKPEHIKEKMAGFYEEIINHYNKIER